MRESLRCCLLVLSLYLTQVHFVEVPLLSQSTDSNVTVFPIQEQGLINITWCAFQFLPTNNQRNTRRERKTNVRKLKTLNWLIASVCVNRTHLRGVSSTASSSSCSLSQSQGAFRFLFLHSHPCLRLILAPSKTSSGPWEGDWNLLPRFPISLTNKQNKQKKVWTSSSGVYINRINITLGSG